MKQTIFVAFVVLSGLVSVKCDCPHQRPGLKLWSDAATWTDKNNPNNGGNVFITEPTIVDVASASLANVVLQDGGMLTFSPEVEIDFRATNIYIYNAGAMEIGSEDCPYTGKLTITLTGNREEHDGETHPKAVLVDAGGTLEIHGEPRLSWTKITETLAPMTENNPNVYFEHAYSPDDTSANDWVNGLIIYIFTVDVSNAPVFKKYAAYDLKYDSHVERLAALINGLEEGDIMMMSSQREIRRMPGEQNADAYDALETLVYGQITGDGILRNTLYDGSTYAFIYQKGNPDSYQEVSNPLGTTSKVSFAVSEDLVFTAWTIGADRTYKQQENFRVSNRDGANPKLRLVDDATTWQEGDKIVIASTDYDWLQAEDMEVVNCADCAYNEIRISGYPTYTHFGEVLYDAVDMRAEIALVSRKLVIRGEMEPECPSFNGNCEHKYVSNKDTFGAHIKILEGYANVHLEHFELYNVGQQTDLGRYPIHFHMCFDKIDSATRPYIRGVSIHDTFARCVTIHGSHGVDVIDSTCYNFMGHGFFLEDGGEKDNTFDGNLALIAQRATGELEPTDGNSPAAFWITNPYTRVVNNVAAGGFGVGIWVIFPEEPLKPSRDYNMMDPLEAQRTMITEFYNNVAHSNHIHGIIIGSRIKDNRQTACCNDWQPRENPLDPDSTPLEFSLKKMTSYKNRFFNAWLEGGLFYVHEVSVSDSANGIMVTNEGQQFEYAGRLSHAVVIGDSINVGEPEEGLNRSLPYPWDPEYVHSGLTLWKGPTRYDHIWLDGFQSNDVYDTAAIAKKRNSPYFISVNTPLRDIEFAFDDGPGLGNIAMTGVEGMNPGWESLDGEKISGFTWYQGDEVHYVVKPDAFSAAAADCKLRENWRLALCKTKYGNLRYYAKKSALHETTLIFARDDLPSAQLEFEMDITTGPQVVLDGSSTYTIHSSNLQPEYAQIIAEGIEIGDKLRIGLCLPLDAEFMLRSFFPVRLERTNNFVAVNSLDELDADDENDGKKYFHDTSTGMLYYKFIGATMRSEDESASCGGGKCPELHILITAGDRFSSDCRDRIYTTEQLNMEKPTLPVWNDVIPAGPYKDGPPKGYGAGYTRPFTSRDVLDGGFSDWSDWSACSKSCGVGVQKKKRLCNNPVPQNGGKPCEGYERMIQSCNDRPCEINGEFSEWSEWAACMKYDSNYCAGYSERSRSCSGPSAAYGGTYCTGSITEVQACDAC